MEAAGSTILVCLYVAQTTGHALFLVDGQRINSASLGSTSSYQFIDPSQIERIEIVRGAKSSIYGSDAVGGVIQIFTKKGDFKPSTIVSTEVGSNVLKRTALATRGAYNQLRYSLDLSYSGNRRDRRTSRMIATAEPRCRWLQKLVRLTLTLGIRLITGWM